MQKWEYKTCLNADFDRIQNLGMQGWELCGIMPKFNTYRDENNFMFYFKRPLVETSIAISNETSDAVGVQH